MIAPHVAPRRRRHVRVHHHVAVIDAVAVAVAVVEVNAIRTVVAAEDVRIPIITLSSMVPSFPRQ
jgi:hypothetical protein